MSSVVRVPSDVQTESKRIAAMRGVAQGEILAEAWTEYMSTHREAFAADLEEAARVLREGGAQDVAAFASRNVKERASAAAQRMRN